MILSHRKVAARGGMTLVEIIVVIAIIALLASLSAGGYMLVMRSQKLNNTEMILQKLEQALNAQKQAFVTQVRNGDIPEEYIAAAGGDRTKAAAVWLNQGGRQVSKYNISGNAAVPEPPLLTQEFPTTFDEAWWNPRYRKPLGGGAGPPAGGAATESSECLFLALGFARGGQAFNPDQAMESGTVLDGDNNGRKEFRDTWGDSLRFRWDPPSPRPAGVELQPKVDSPTNDPKP